MSQSRWGLSLLLTRVSPESRDQEGLVLEIEFPWAAYSGLGLESEDHRGRQGDDGSCPCVMPSPCSQLSSQGGCPSSPPESPRRSHCAHSVCSLPTGPSSAHTSAAGRSRLHLHSHRLETESWPQLSRVLGTWSCAWHTEGSINIANMHACLKE